MCTIECTKIAGVWTPTGDLMLPSRIPLTPEAKVVCHENDVIAVFIIEYVIAANSIKVTGKFLTSDTCIMNKHCLSMQIRDVIRGTCVIRLMLSFAYLSLIWTIDNFIFLGSFILEACIFFFTKRRHLPICNPDGK